MRAAWLLLAIVSGSALAGCVIPDELCSLTNETLVFLHAEVSPESIAQALREDGWAVSEVNDTFGAAKAWNATVGLDAQVWRGGDFRAVRVSATAVGARTTSPPDVEALAAGALARLRAMGEIEVPIQPSQRGEPHCIQGD